MSHTAETLDPSLISLRPATTADQKTIKQMVRGAHLNPIGLKWQRFTLAVTPDGDVIGCIQHKPHRGGVVELASLVVNKRWRRQGIARRLIDHIRETAGLPLWLMCAAPLAKFYEPFGFRRVYLGDPMPGYFRWMLRLTFVLNRVSSQNLGLAIMVWESASSFVTFN